MEVFKSDISIQDWNRITIGFIGPNRRRVEFHSSYPDMWFYKEFDPEVADFVVENAAKIGHMRLVRFAIERGASYFDDALWVAASHGHLPIVKLLLEKGAKGINSALYWAARFGRASVVKCLLEQYPTNCETALKEADVKCHVETMKHIVRHMVVNHMTIPSGFSDFKRHIIRIIEDDRFNARLLEHSIGLDVYAKGISQYFV
ncbi:MAG: ankyrin repeat domain-containing protein [Promethearchaeota archaeon]